MKKSVRLLSLLQLSVILLAGSVGIENNRLTQSVNLLSPQIKKAISNQEQLWVNADSLDDGGVYFIRNCSNTTFVWDMPNSNVSSGTKPALYQQLGYGNQRFILRKQWKYNDNECYTISPLYAPDSTLKTSNADDHQLLFLGEDENSSLNGFMSNKFAITKGKYGFVISSGASTFGKYIVPKDSTTENGTQLEQITSSSATSNPLYQWEFCKTDTLGLDLQNKVKINGNATSYFNITPPSTGSYIIETSKDNANVDTYLELYDLKNKKIASNDDISTGNRFSRITYNFTSTDDVSLRVRGFNSNANGYVYLTLRPKNALYFSAVYDYDKNNNDRPSSLNETKQYLSDYHVEIQANRGKNAIIEKAPNGKQKINSEYYVFSGHGFSNAAGVQFYNGNEKESFLWREIPSMSGTSIALWMSCHGARNYYKYGSSGDMTSMAYQTVLKGADYSLGYVGEIYDTTQRIFPKKFFEALQTRSIPDAINTATKWTEDENWWYWTFFGRTHDDIKNPVLYHNGDALRSDCGNGKYDSSQKKVAGKDKALDYLNENQYVVNLEDKTDLESAKKLASSPEESAYQYKFITKNDGQIVKLGFNCDSTNGKVSYFDFTDNKPISAQEFEAKMGTPVQSTIDQFYTQNDSLSDQ